MPRHFGENRTTIVKQAHRLTGWGSLTSLIEEPLRRIVTSGLQSRSGSAVAGTHEPVGAPQPGDPLWRRQHPGKRRRFRPPGGRGECLVEQRHGRDRDFGRRPRHRTRHAEADRRALSVAAAQRRRGERVAASALASSSPARCWSAPAQRCRLRNRTFPDHGAVVQIMWPREPLRNGRKRRRKPTT